MLFMDEGGAVLHGLLRIEYSREDFIFNLDEVEGLFSNIEVCGGDRSDFVS
jgi:adenylate cyclase class IV